MDDTQADILAQQLRNIRKHITSQVLYVLDINFGT